MEAPPIPITYIVYAQTSCSSLKSGIIELLFFGGVNLYIKIIYFLLFSIIQAIKKKQWQIWCTFWSYYESKYTCFGSERLLHRNNLK